MFQHSLALLVCLLTATTTTAAMATPSANTNGRSLRVGSLNIRFSNDASHSLSSGSNHLQARDQVHFEVPEEETFPTPHWPHTSRPPQKREEPWYKRRSYLADQILFENLDLIGFQEVIHHQLQDLKVLLGDTYDCVGVGRDDGKQRGEAVPIFWKKSELQLLEVEHFWLSETPHVPGSVSWDSVSLKWRY